MKKPLIIAELGTGHGGSLGQAKELVDAAAAAGADCVKFQIVYADEILHPNAGLVPLPGGDTPLYNVFKKLEVNEDFWPEIQKYAESKNVRFLATPFGPKSAALLKRLRPAAVKIASPELNYTGLLRESASWGARLILSTGVSTLGDIERAISTVREAGNVEIWLLHCVTAYPALPSEYNLRLLVSLCAIFGLPVGLSDHSLNPGLLPSLAAALGAAAVEKHFCLSRDGGGLDDPIALPPAQFAEMAALVNETAAVVEQDGARAAIAGLERRFGEAAVTEALGDGVKRPAPAEAANYGRTNRSIHAVCGIKKGELLSAHNMAVLRTEKVLRPGLAPCFWETLIGRPARTTIPAGEGIRFEDV
jgi:sialic acid synthase SpsE